MIVSLVLAPLVLCAHAIAALPTASTIQACKDISKVAPGRVFYPLSIPYISETSKYWSTALREIKPACVVLPRIAAEVSAAVTVLNRCPDVKFAVKSGGHDPNPGHATIKDGVLIATRHLSGTTYDRAKNLAYVKPGGEWNDVIGVLDRDGVAVLGGRLGASMNKSCCRLAPNTVVSRDCRSRWISSTRRNFVPQCPARACR
jgi:hypothetical protein